MKRQRCGDRGAIRADDHARNSPIPPALLRVERFFLGIQRTEQEHADRRHGRRHCGGNGGPQMQKPPDEQKRRKNGQCGQQKAGKLPLGVDPAGIAPDKQKGAEKQKAFPQNTKQRSHDRRDPEKQGLRYYQKKAVCIQLCVIRIDHRRGKQPLHDTLREPGCHYFFSLNLESFAGTAG